MKLKLVSLKKAMESIGLSEVKINNGFNYQSGFGKDSEGQIWYVNTGDWRWRSQLGTLIRTARDYKDFTGGQNQYWFDDKLAEMGLALKPKFSKNGE